MLLLVGLGNPGRGHANNRHNVGFMALDRITGVHPFRPPRRRFHGLLAEGRIGPESVLALKPLTYMNRCGSSVAEAVRFYKLPLDRVIVFHDDLDLAPGRLKVKRGGGNAGHNGLRSIDAHIGRDYRRVRLGIGHPGDRDKVLPWVLRDVPKAERGTLARLLDAVAEAAPLLAEGDDAGFMSKVALIVNPPPPKPPKPGPRAAADEAADAEG